MRLILVKSLSRRARSFSVVRPHHAGEAYSSRAMVVALVTVWSAAAGRPWALRTLRAYMDWLQEAITLSTWLDARKSSVMVMPRMTIDLPLLIPERGGGSLKTSKNRQIPR